MTVYEQIGKILDSEIKPMIQSHGGDVKLTGFSDGIATVMLSGACAGCPSADLGTREMIEELLTDRIPEVKSVNIDHAIPEDMLEFARKILNGELKDK